MPDRAAATRLGGRQAPFSPRFTAESHGLIDVIGRHEIYTTICTFERARTLTNKSRNQLVGGNGSAAWRSPLIKAGGHTNIDYESLIYHFPMTNSY